MLTLHFEIHQDNKDAEVQARGVVAALVSIYGPSVLPAAARYTAPASQVIAQSPNAPEWATPAPDGYPVDADSVPFAPAPPESLPPLPTQDRDTAGIPWDERIHASTKTTNRDGTWTRRRNTPDEVFDKVMAELKAANTAMTLEAAAGLTAPTPEPPQPSAAEAFTPPPSVVIPPAVPQPPVHHVEQAAQNAVANAMAAVNDKAAEPVEIMKALNAKQVPADKLAAVLGKAGLKGLAEVFTAAIDARRIIAAELAAL